MSLPHILLTVLVISMATGYVNGTTVLFWYTWAPPEVAKGNTYITVEREWLQTCRIFPHKLRPKYNFMECQELARSCEVRVEVYTFYVYTTHYTFSSSDANLYVKIEGRLGNSGILFLNNGQNIMESGKMDQFPITTDYGAIYRVAIGHDNTGIGASWSMRKLVIKDHVRGTTQLVYCDCWIPDAYAEVSKYFPENFDECGSNPCQNEATCIDGNEQYECTCSPGWTGLHCELGYGSGSIRRVRRDVDECVASPCENDGTCINKQPGYNCSCLEGFNGTNCETDIDECLSGDACRGGGTCQNTAPGYVCVCPEGFTGSTCATDIDECNETVPVCWNGATCVNLSPGYSCTCPEGLTGELCGDDVDECTNGTHRCVNGECVNHHVGYSCICAVAWTGTYCDTDINECAGNNPCLHNGVCENRSPGQYCHNCDSGWTGAFCETDLNECLEKTDNVTTLLMCSNGGQCINTDGSAFCVCTCGYTGMTCEDDIDECSANYTMGTYTVGNVTVGNFTVGNYSTVGCENNATCVNTYGGYTCTCTDGYSGLQCQIEYLRLEQDVTTAQEITGQDETPILNNKLSAEQYAAIEQMTQTVVTPANQRLSMSLGLDTTESPPISQTLSGLESSNDTSTGNDTLPGNETMTPQGRPQGITYIHPGVWFAVVVPVLIVGVAIYFRVKLMAPHKVKPNPGLRYKTETPELCLSRRVEDLPEPCGV